MASGLRVQITPVISTAAITAELKKINTQFNANKINIPLSPINKKVTKSITDTKSAFGGLVSAIGKVAIWTVATSAVFGTIRALKNLVGEFINLEDQLIAIERVTSGLSMEKIFENSLESSITLAVGLKEVLSVTEELGRTYADLDENQLQLAASNAILLASVTDLTSDSAVSGLIAITQAYNIAIEDSISVVDALNVVNNNYAIGAADLSKSLERSAAAASEVGISFSNLIGYTTAIKTSTRESGSVIGNSLKTIMIRLQSNSDALREVQQAGVDVYGENGQLRDAEKIISELAGKWDGLSKNQKVNIGVAAAGKRQYTRFAALMQNFDIATESASAALSNQGNAMTENEKRLATISAQTQILKNKTLDLAQSFGGQLKPAIVAMTNLFTTLVGGLKFMIDTFGLGTIAALGFILILPKLILFVNGLTLSLAALKAVKTAMDALPYMAITLAIGFVVTQIIKLNKENKENIEIQNKSIDSINRHSDAIGILVDRYEELSNANNLTVDEGSELVDVQNELTSLMPSLVSSQDEFGNTLLVSVNLLKEELGILKLIASEKAAEDLKKLEKQIGKTTNSIEVMTTWEAEYAREKYRQSKKTISSLKELRELLGNSFYDVSSSDATKAMVEYNKVLNENKDIYGEYKNALLITTFGTNKLNDTNKTAIDTFDNLINSEGLLFSNTEDVGDALKHLVENIASGVRPAYALEGALLSLGITYKGFADSASEVGVIDYFTDDELNSIKLFDTVMRDTFGTTEIGIKAMSKAINIVKLYGDKVALTAVQQGELNNAISAIEGSGLFDKYNGNILENISLVERDSNAMMLLVKNQDEFIDAVVNGSLELSDNADNMAHLLSVYMSAEDIFKTLIDIQDEYSDSAVANLGKQSEEFSSMIDNQIDELDRLRNTIEFDETIGGLNSDRIEIEKELSRLQNDNSIEGITKRNALEEKLAENKEDMASELRDRDFDIQKSNLEALQELTENNYETKIAKEIMLNEIIKERITAQSEALSNDVTSLEKLETIITNIGNIGSMGIIQDLIDSGVFDLDEYKSEDIDKITSPFVPAGDDGKIYIDKIILEGKATEEDGKNILEGIMNYAYGKNLVTIVKNR